MKRPVYCARVVAGVARIQSSAGCGRRLLHRVIVVVVMSLLPISSSSSRVHQPTKRRSRDSSKILVLLVKITFVSLLCCSSYLAGSILGHQSLGDSIGEGTSVGRLIHGDISLSSANEFESGRSGTLDCKQVEKAFIELQVKKELEEHNKQSSSSEVSSDSQTRRFPATSMVKFVNGIARVKKDELTDFFDFGNPMERGKGTGEEDAIILYQNKKAFPSTDTTLTSAVEYNDGKGIPLTDPQTATENCDAMNVIFTANPGNTRQCTAIVGNFESYHVQRWMKVDTVKSTKVQADLPLAPVSRGYASRGKANFYSPPSDGKFSPVKRHWEMLKTFLQNVDSILDDLRPILKKVARNNAVVIMTCNHGQSALLMNFACSAQRRGFDLSNILVFPTDIETKELAEGLGLATYFDEKVCM